MLWEAPQAQLGVLLVSHPASLAGTALQGLKSALGSAKPNTARGAGTAGLPANVTEWGAVLWGWLLGKFAAKILPAAAEQGADEPVGAGGRCLCCIKHKSMSHCPHA